MIRPSRNHPGYIAFLGHRLSGVALALFLPLHFLALGMAIEGADGLDRFLALADRPLVKLEDFERFAGLDAKVEMAYVMDGRRRFRGRLLGVAGDKIRMTVDGLPVELPHADIQRAKLIMTDALLAPKEEQKTS